MTEADIMRSIQLALSPTGARLFRNQVGTYRLALRECPACQGSGRVLSSGLVVGSSDLIGWAKGGTFLAVEVKRGPAEKPTPEQATFIEQVNKSGGIAFVAWSPQQAREVLDAVVLRRGEGAPPGLRDDA